MGTNGRLTASARALRYWLLQHSGQADRVPQCPNHPPVEELTYRQLSALLKAELDQTVSRYWLAQLCDQLEIPRRRRRGPPTPSDGELKERARERYQRWYQRVRRNPKRWQQYLAKKRTQQQAQRSAA